MRSLLHKAMRKLQKLLLITYFLATAIHSKGQSLYYFKHYQVENGLSNNKVSCIAQDKKGFMWFGTIDGLNRFDGYTFKTFRHDPSNSKSIGNNSIDCLYSDDEDNLWIGTHKGIYKYNPVYESFELLPFTKNQMARTLKMDKAKNLWFILDYTLFKYNPHSGQLQSFASLGSNVTSVCVTPDGGVWISTFTGLIKKYDVSSGNFYGYDIFYGSKSSAVNFRWIENIYATNEGYLLIGTLNQGIKLFDTKTEQYKTVVTYNRDGIEIYAKDFMQSSSDEYWAASENGIMICNLRTGNCTDLRMEYDNPYSLSDNAIYSLYKDKEGGIWAGSRFGGVNYYPPSYIFFTKYFSRPGTHSINGNGVHEICPDTYGNLWIGTEDAGLNKLNLKTGAIQHFKPDGKKGSISFYNIHGLLVEGNSLWIGTYQNGIDKMNIKTGKVVKHYTIGKLAFNSNFIVHFYKTHSGEILAGTWEGLYKYNKLTDSFDPVPGFEFQTQSILEDENGLLWICTLGNGVYTFDENNNSIHNFRYDSKNPTALCNNMVNGEFRDSKNRLWFATEGGLCKYDPLKKTFKTYTVNNGLPSNFLFKILEDKKENLWISSTKGLICFNPETENIKVFTTANGLLNDQFNWNSAYGDSSGRMYFGSVKGMISFVPEQFQTNTIIPPVYITGIQVYNKEVSIDDKNSPLHQSISYTKKIILEHNQSSISIDFAALSYTSPERNEYAYKLERLDKDWTFLKTNRKVYFTELPPGNYTFKIKASNSSGVWNKGETILLIEVMPPLWASKGAYLLYAIIIISIAVIIIQHYRNRFLEKNKIRMEQLQHEKEKELYQNKIDFFTNVAHEIRTPLTLIQGPMEDIMNYADEVPEIKNNLKIMERNTNRLLDLTGQLLDFRQVEVKGFSLNFEQINISELLQNTHLNFQPLAVHHQFNYSLSLQVKDFYVCADADSIQKILNNLYSNAIKYARKEVEVLFRVVREENYFEIEIQNDGYLIPWEQREKIFEPFFRIKETETQKGTGIGLALALTLTQLHKGTLELREPKNNRNVFVLHLPIQIENNFSTHDNNTKKIEKHTLNLYQWNLLF
jgi:signal transduction histidine kinase/ligand-binding sensor domain-containing protein